MVRQHWYEILVFNKIWNCNLYCNAYYNLLDCSKKTFLDLILTAVLNHDTLLLLLLLFLLAQKETKVQKN